MRILHTKKALQEVLQADRTNGLSIGFVPTMGALHNGHLSLAQSSMSATDRTVVSIFVNPKQFNDPTDLNKYPRPMEQDLALLKAIGVQYVFTPTVDEVYSDTTPIKVDLNGLDKVMEGAHRLGHFDGVVQVVHRLFDLVQPHKTFFGEKDRQQLLIIERMAEALSLPLEIIACPIVRSVEGLALSSRNALLSPTQKETALLLYRSLQFAQKQQAKLSAKELVEKVKADFAKEPMAELEYFEFFGTKPFRAVDELANMEEAYAFIAARIGNVRLIDNILLKK